MWDIDWSKSSKYVCSMFEKPSWHYWRYILWSFPKAIPLKALKTNCISSYSVTDIPKQAVLYFCRNCERYLQPPTEWIQCSLESRELLALCLKKLKGLKDVKLVDAGFIWTEPHSKRIKVKLTVHKEVFGGATLQQVFIVEFTITNQMCDDCHRTEAKDFWKCLVQVRQRSENKKTFYYLEQLILKHKAHENTLGIKPEHGGLDFYYANENHARKMLDFLNTMLPIKCTESKRLISHDIHSNTYNCKFTFAIDIAPISKDSLICLPKKLAQQLGSISQVCLVSRVANTIHLIDPLTAQSKILFFDLFSISFYFIFWFLVIDGIRFFFLFRFRAK